MAAIVYSLYVLVFTAMPVEYPVNAVDFNWAPVMFAAVMLFSLVYYFVRARKEYEGPVAYVIQRPLEERNEGLEGRTIATAKDG